jgi:hypothetical protein
MSGVAVPDLRSHLFVVTDEVEHMGMRVDKFDLLRHHSLLVVQYLRENAENTGKYQLFSRGWKRNK